MGNATSSALRTDDPVTKAPAPGGDGPAFGSLASLGAPKKLKKKPVLVLDPEELEKAHMMFQEASAELLGEEVEKPERGASVLGLAPIDDEDATPEDMGTSDDSEAGDDSEDIPSAEDVLRMTASRPAMDEAEEALIAEQLESLDVDHRIFPSLPLKSEEEIAAEEAKERARSQASEAEDALEESASLQAPTQLPGDDADITFEPAAIVPMPQVHAFPVNPLPEPEAEIEPLPETEAEPVPETEPMADVHAEPATENLAAGSLFGEEPFLDFPTQPLHYEQPTENLAEEVEETATDHGLVEQEVTRTDIEAVPEPEPRANDAFEFELEDEWEVDDALGLENEDHSEENPEEPFDASHERELEAAEHEGSYTEIDDEPVDGYAFMYAANPRARTLHALADGESNSLRAKLIREREAAAAELEKAEQAPSIWARFTGWLRRLFG